ncbi:MAG: hypothetical protein E5Y89_00770 [Mesorhizobium sp.]|nr:MAG: hypothetical protein E5Y89_00770 [Mesorhizobium sp.]
MSGSSENQPKAEPATLPAPIPAPNTDYNPIFEKLVMNTPDDEVLGVIAYGAYKKAKWEWAQGIFNKHGRPPTEEELKAYIAAWTPSQLEYVRNNAAQVLAAYADSVIDAARAGIVTEALKGTFGASVRVNLISAALYTLILIVLAFGLSFTGIDFVGIFDHAKAITSSTSPTPKPDTPPA